MTEWAQEALRLLVTATVALAVLAWLARAIVTHWLSQAAEQFKSDLSARAARELEATKAQLKVEFDKDLALFQASLRERSFATEAIVVRLYERQLDVVSELYRRLAAMHIAFQSLMAPFQPAGAPDQDEKRKLAAESGNDFLQYFRSNKIFLSAALCAVIDEFIKAHNDAWFEYVEVPTIWANSHSGGGKVFEARLNAWKFMIGDAARLLLTVETEFRKLTGVVEQEALYARIFVNRRPADTPSPAPSSSPGSAASSTPT